MTRPNQGSYLLISEDAALRMRKMLAESTHEDAVIFFCLENQELAELAQSSETGVGVDLDEVESLMHSVNFLSKSRVFVKRLPVRISRSGPSWISTASPSMLLPCRGAIRCFS